MKNVIKQLLRQTFILLRMPVTKNIQYDICTEKILKRVLKHDSNCIDVGAHKGEILDLFLRFAPKGKHTAFEPIPHFFEQLNEKYNSVANVLPYALAAENGKTEFNVVVDDLAYSGLKQRQYKSTNTTIEKIEVEVRTLDSLLMNDARKIDLIKIDVEGGEYGVLQGATELLIRAHPLLIFEFGKGASEYYGTTPAMIFEFLQQHEYNLHTLPAFLKNGTELTLEMLVHVYEGGEEYYFVAT
ncbi:MAG: FkbM family methyltransferase [Flavobacteriales bacterium]